MTAADRFSRALPPGRGVRAIARWCRRYRHLEVREQWRTLYRKVAGHFGYYGTSGNSKAPGDLRDRVKRVWRTKVRFRGKVRTVRGKWLSRRSQKARVAPDRFALVEARYPLPPARLARSVRVT